MKKLIYEDEQKIIKEQEEKIKKKCSRCGTSSADEGDLCQCCYNDRFR